jgi:hypothetical protein
MNYLIRSALPRFISNLTHCGHKQMVYRISVAPVWVPHQLNWCHFPHRHLHAAKYSCRIGPQHGAASAPSAIRTIFTDACIDVDKLPLVNNKQKLMVVNPETFKDKLRADFAAHGVRNVFITDMELFLALSENAADMELSRQLIEALLKENVAIFKRMFFYCA